MKKIIINLLFVFYFLINCGYAQMMSRVAFYDLEGEPRSLNSKIRAEFNSEGLVGQTKVTQLYDSLIMTNDLGMSVVKLPDGRYGFLFYNYTLEPLFVSQSLGFVDLEDTDFRVDIDLGGRKLVLTDHKSHTVGHLSDVDIELVYPIAIGGFTSQNTDITTPDWSDVYLDKKTIISKRWSPSYYKGKPFLRVMKSKNIEQGWTGIGIHRRMNSKLRRSPDSHGCIRMREWDLKTVHAIIYFRDRRYTDISIHKQFGRYSYHPYKLHNTSYQKVKYFSSSPHIRRDRHGLTIYKHVYENPVPIINDILTASNFRTNYVLYDITAEY
ncbi:MAG: L,D-transpeptidase [Bacteriovoracaceae bacterium]|nr:L,D-transpeptidase [Bacteriovoracaceae bacterium]